MPGRTDQLGWTTRAADLFTVLIKVKADIRAIRKVKGLSEREEMKANLQCRHNSFISGV